MTHVLMTKSSLSGEKQSFLRVPQNQKPGNYWHRPPKFSTLWVIATIQYFKFSIGLMKAVKTMNGGTWRTAVYYIFVNFFERLPGDWKDS